MSLTPLHISIGIHYYVSPDQHPMLHNLVHRRYVDDLVRAGLLRISKRDIDGSDIYEKTDGLGVWIDALCATPFPVQRWVMPEPLQS